MKIPLRHLLASLAVLAAATLAGCGGSGGGGDGGSPVTGQDPPGSATVGGTAQTEVVTVTGAGGAQLVVPPGAVEQPVTVRIAADSTGAPNLPAWLQAAGPMYALTPHESNFAQAVEVRIPRPDTPVPQDQRLALAKASLGGEWEILGLAQEVDGMLVAPIDSFSFVMPVLIHQVVVFEPWSATATLECGGQDCQRLVGPTDVTLRVVTRGLVLPQGCDARSYLQARVTSERTTYGLSQYTETYRFGSPLQGGTFTQRWFEGSPRPMDGGRVSVSLVCPGGPTVYVGSATLAWRRVQQTLVLPLQIQVPDVTAGSRGVATALLLGGANGILYDNWQRYPYEPTPTNTATVDWERSDDGGASWRFVATSYQHMADATPFGNQAGAWRYWRVQHEFTTDAHATGTVKFRVLACVDARERQFVNGQPTNVQTTRRCAPGDVASGNVLAQAVLPAFTTLPRSQLVLSGQTASFSVQATGLPAPTLQWQTRPANSNGAWTDVPAAQGGNSANFTTALLAPGDNGTQFRVVASNAAGSSESPPVTVSVSDQAVAPSITAELSAIRALRGGDATFAVGVRGTEPLNFQWRVNGQVVAGQNAPVLNLQSVQAAFTVQVTVSNAAGTASSRTVDLLVFDGAVPEAPVAIELQPAPLSIASGQTAVFAVRATGGGSLHYRWQYNGQDVVGFPDSPVLTLPNANPGFNGTYRVVVSNGTSSATSDAVALQVAPPVQPVPPGFVVQPVGLSLHAGQSATFAGVARGTGAISYQWLREGVPIPGATQPVLTLPAVAAGDAGNYTLRATDASGLPVTSTPAALVVSAAPGLPVYTVQTFIVHAVQGDTPTIAMLALGTPAPRCLWLKNGAVLPGATDCSGLTLPAVTLADHGSVYTSIAYNEAGAVVGGPAVLNVTAPAAPAITQQPVDVSVVEGGVADLLALASGSPPPDPQWYVNGQRIPFGTGITFTEGSCTVGYDQTGSRLRLINVPLACDGKVFTFTAVNAHGSATSNAVTLTVTSAVPAGALTATQVVAGYEWSMVLRPDRTVWAWGWLHRVDGTVVVSNLAGVDQARRPVRMYPGVLTDVRQIAGWYDGFWALTGEPGSAASRVLHWGNARSANDGRGADGQGNLGVLPQFRVNATPVPVLERRSVLGTLQAAPVDRVCSIAATSDRILMIRALDAFGSPTDCAAGSAKTVWVAGTLSQYSADAVGVVVPVAGLPAGVPAQLIAAPQSSQSSAGPVMVRMEDGRLFGWGTNIGNLFGLPLPASQGYVGSSAAPQALPPTWGAASDAAFTYTGLFVLRADGSAGVSGRNDNGELGLGPQPQFTINNGPLPLLASAGAPLDGVQALISSQVQVSLALRQGRILAWGAANQPLQGGSAARLDYPRLLPASGDGWRALSAGNAHALAIAANGAVYTWGSGVRGALGNGVDGGSALAPTLVNVP